MRKNSLRWMSLIVVPILCTSCQIMPVEEELPAAPVIRSYEAKEYEQTMVIRGDMVLNKTVRCTYMPAKRERLSFSLGGEYIDSVYVSEGQQVRAGDLLAELEQGDLYQQISSQEYQIQLLNLRKSHIQKNQSLELSRQDALTADIDRQIASVRQLMEDLRRKKTRTFGIYRNRSLIRRHRNGQTGRRIRQWKN